LWKLRDPAFRNKTPFDRRLSIIENSNTLPEGVELRNKEDVNGNRVDDKVFSESGAINDSTLPTGFENSTHLFLSAAQRGFADAANRKFILAGGNFSYCLFKTFKSLVEIKEKQGERLQVLIPLPAVYYSDSVRPDVFLNYLRDWESSGYRITVDGRIESDARGKEPFVELHWFKTFPAMFGSPFFPELSNPAALARVIDNFKHV
jgi:hypothetical protein